MSILPSAIPGAPDIEQARRFLELIAPNSKSFTFQVFDDSPSRRQALARILHGTLEEHAEQLVSLNAEGAGIFVVVNETDGRGRKAENIINVRALFVDIDTRPKETLQRITATMPTPSMIVKSSGRGCHVYWLVDGCPVEMFTRVQRALAGRFDTDQAVSDSPRVMRLPGFLHSKGVPRLVELVHPKPDMDRVRYAFDDFIRRVGLETGQSNIIPIRKDATDDDALIAHAGFMIPERVEEGKRNDTLLRFVSHLRGRSVPEDLIPKLANDFNRARCYPPLDDSEVIDVIGRYPRAGTWESSDWPDPTDIKPALPDVPRFDMGLLPVSVRPFVEDASERMQCPPEFIAVPLTIALAAVLGNTWGIAPKARDEGWMVTPVLWGGVVGRPGTKKSPAIASAHAPLSVLEADLDAAFQAALAIFAAEKLSYEVATEHARKAAKAGAPVVLPLEPLQPHPERLVVNDTTYQKLGEILQFSPRGVLVTMDELVGLLESLRTEGQESARGFYLAGWNGNQPYRIDRIKRGSAVIPRLALWLCGGIQPGKLDAYVREAVSEGGGADGLLQRFQLLVWPDQSPWRNVDRPADLVAYANAEATFKRLRSLSASAVGANPDMRSGTAYLHFTTEAQEIFDEWRGGLETSLRTKDLHPALESHFSKYASLVPALALVIHLADEGLGPVGKAPLMAAIRWAKYLKKHAERIYASATNRAAGSAKALADKIVAGRVSEGFTLREVHRNGWSRLSSVEDVQAAIDWLVDSSWVRAVEQRTGGRPSTTYKINPKLRLEA